MSVSGIVTHPLKLVQVPLLLLWGELDPWITPASADKIQKLYPAAERIDIRGGHCPHVSPSTC